MSDDSLDLDVIVDRVGADSTITLGTRVLDNGIRFAVQILLARLLGVAMFGLYSLAYVVIKLAHRVSLLGLHTGMVRFVSKNEATGEDWDGVLLVGIVVPLAVGVLAGTALHMGADTIAAVMGQSGVARPLRLFAFLLPVYTFGILSSSILQGHGYVRGMAVVRYVLLPVGYLAGVLVAFWRYPTLEGAIAGFAVGVVLAAIGGGALVVRTIDFGLGRETVTSARRQFRPLLSYSMPLYLSGFMFVLLSNADMLMVGALTGPDIVGQYRASMQLANVYTLVLGSTNAVIAPIISSMEARDRYDGIDRLYKLVTRWIFTANVLLFAGSVVLAQDLLRLFGSEFVVAWPFFIILALGQLANSMVGGVEILLKMTGNERIVLVDNAGAFVLNVVLNYVLILQFGGLGAALATATTFATVNFVQFYQVRSRIDVSPFTRRLLKPVVAGVASAGVGALVYSLLPWYGVGVVIVVSYGFALLALGPEPVDRRLVEKLAQRVRLTGGG